MALRCLNPSNIGEPRSCTFAMRVAAKLQPEQDTSAMFHGWRVLQIDPRLSVIKMGQWVEYFWGFQVKTFYGHTTLPIREAGRQIRILT